MNVKDLETRVASLEKKSARRRKTVGDTVNDLEFLSTRDLDNVSIEDFSRIARDRRLSKELKAAIRGFPKAYAKYLEMYRMVKRLSKEEKETVALAYSEQMDDIVKKLSGAIKLTSLTYRGKKLSPGIYVEKIEKGQNKGVLDTNKFRIKYVMRPWDFAQANFGDYPSRYVRTKQLPKDFVLDDFYSELSKAFSKTIDRHLPGFSSTHSSYSLVNANYHGNAVWELSVTDLIKYIER